MKKKHLQNRYDLLHKSFEDTLRDAAFKKMRRFRDTEGLAKRLRAEKQTSVTLTVETLEFLLENFH